MKKWRVEFEAQYFDCDSYDSARKQMEALLNIGVWWFTCTTIEPPYPPAVKTQARSRRT